MSFKDNYKPVHQSSIQMSDLQLENYNFTEVTVIDDRIKISPGDEGLTYACTKCYEEFENEYKVNEHIQTKHEEDVISLSDIKSNLLKTAEFDLEALLKSIPEDFLKSNESEEDFPDTVNDNKKVSCNECKFTTNSRKNLIIHINMVHDLTFHTCKQCNTRTKTEDALKYHVERNHVTNVEITSKHDKTVKTRNDECEDVNTDITDSQNMDFSSISNEDKVNGKSLSCDKCQFSTNSDRNLRMHKKLAHEAMQALHCFKCPIKLKSNEALRLHMNKKHDIGQEIKCDQCDFKGVTTKVMLVHIKRKHSEILYHKCDECKDEFKGKMSLALHKRNHIAAFKCDKCSFKGISVRSLNIHNNKVHTQSSTPQRGTKRDLGDKSPNVISDTVKIALPKLNESPTRSQKKVKTDNSIDVNQFQQNTLTNRLTKETEVIGGEGWSLKRNNFASNIVTKANKNIVDKETKVTSVPPVVVCELPEHKDSVLQIVLGDGTCCMRCVAVHLDLGEEKGPELSRELNKHMSKNREVYRQSMSFPRTVYKGRGQMSETFEDSEDEVNRFFDWLDSSEDAVYIWRESADMIAIANYFNMEIEVVKIDDSGNIEKPTQLYEPDHDYEQTQNKKPKITLLNSSDHFNLIVRKNSRKNPVEQSKYRCNFCNTQEVMTASLEIHMEQKHPAEMIKDLKKENCTLKAQLRNQDTNITRITETDKIKSMQTNDTKKPQRKLTPRVETIPKKPNEEYIQGNDIFRFSEVFNCDHCGEVFSIKTQLDNHMQKMHFDTYMSKMEVTEDPNEVGKHSEMKFKCMICKLVRNTESQLEKHMINHREEGDWICQVCPFQTNYVRLLREHMKEMGHTFNLLQIQEDKLIKCNFCDGVFKSKNQLSRHRKDVHVTFKPCREPNECPFQSECFFNHDPIPQGFFRCFQCGEEFRTRHTMMTHRKNIHEGVKVCIKYTYNQCKRGLNCWWKHEGQNNLDFQQAPENMAPPVLTPPPQVWLQPTPTPHPQPILVLPQQRPSPMSNQIMMEMLMKLEESVSLMKALMSQGNLKEP
jgi:hypothetical protein